MFGVLFSIIQVLLNVIWWIIFVQAILSILISFNVINTYNDFVSALWTGLRRLTEPMYRPLRRILPDAQPLDIAPLAVLVILYILNRIIIPALYGQIVASGLS
ncbi:YggT family protein [Sphingomonas sp. AOB5]|uniref:YggT family protein n=1 Tax=Sphingomonas sp. AOB5 TaxID=3034017 RepID=UPI0023F88FD1|nr:YggT family protein [Sphingomonas sp. AOB5]MDF7776981.1 YggT family protein [Sphingomonas sp. AOB5]